MTEESLIEKAQAAALRLEQANAVAQELVKRQEAIEARRALGGNSEAGIPREPELTQEQKDKIETLALFKGTVVEQALNR
jgi:hypothetical protein